MDPSGKLANYSVSTTNGTLNVTAAALTVVANNATRTYGAANPAFTGTITGIQNGDNITAHLCHHRRDRPARWGLSDYAEPGGPERQAGQLHRDPPPTAR